MLIPLHWLDCNLLSQGNLSRVHTTQTNLDSPQISTNLASPQISTNLDSPQISTNLDSPQIFIVWTQLTKVRPRLVLRSFVGGFGLSSPQVRNDKM